MRLKLTTKFTLVTSIILMGGMILFAYENMTFLQEMCYQEALKDADNLGETIIRTTHYQMLEDDRQRVYQMVDEVAAQKGIERIRLFNKEGMITYSTHQSEIGTVVDLKAEACSGCHSGENPVSGVPTSARSRIYTETSQEGERFLGVAKEIENQVGCYTAACHFHPEEVDLLGILDVHISLSSMESQINAYRNHMLIFSVVLLSILSLCMVMLTQGLVNFPVKNLLKHVRRLSRGDLKSRVEFTRHDELGELAVAFNDMTIHLNQARDELQTWAATLESKVAQRTDEIQSMQFKLVRAEKLASLGEMAAGIAHEINNPLTGILMLSSLVARDPSLSPEVKKDLEVIIGETQRCARIVKGLLDFAHESVPEKRFASIHQILDSTLELVENQALFQNIQIEKEYGEVSDALVDPDQMRQVFMNIILNAGQAMPCGGTLCIRTEQRDLVLLVHIRDTGCGISEGNMEKIFDPFFSTKDHDGNGLGLSITYGIIQNHGGQIEVHSRLGEGTTFTISLPLEEPEQPGTDGNQELRVTSRHSLAPVDSQLSQ